MYVDEGQVFEQYTRNPRGMLLSLGAFSYVVEATKHFLSMNIGRYCSIARGTNLVQGNHPIDSVTTNPYHYGNYAKKNLPEELKYQGPVGAFPRSFGRTEIGNDVWIGGHCTIKGGVLIGHGAVIASGSVVVKDIAPYTIVGGNPARPIRDRFPRELAERLLTLKWWDWSPASFRDLNMYDVESFLDGMETRLERGELVPFSPRQFTFRGGQILSL